jgi:hypothetical protein
MGILQRKSVFVTGVCSAGFIVLSKSQNMRSQTKLVAILTNRATD